MENKDLERAIYMWFDMKYGLYNKLETDDSIYLYDEGQVCADFRIIKKVKYIYYKWGLYDEFSEIFPIELDEFKEVIAKWVGDTFNLKGFTSDHHRRLGKTLVGDTFNLEGFTSVFGYPDYRYELEIPK